MKSTEYWSSPNIGANNSSGFNALPGGFRNDIGDFTLLDAQATWWSGLNSDNSMGRALYYESPNDNIFRYPLNTRNGNSIRCLKD
jgi:uncharacterized protein (TIGR02145 family)